MTNRKTVIAHSFSNAFGKWLEEPVAISFLSLQRSIEGMCPSNWTKQSHFFQSAVLPIKDENVDICLIGNILHGLVVNKAFGSILKVNFLLKKLHNYQMKSYLRQ